MGTIEILNINRLIKKLDNIANADLTEKMNKAVALVHGQAKALAPADTGALRESIHMEVKRDGKKVIGRVYTNLNYAPYVEFGTGIKGNGTYPYKTKDFSLSYRSTPWVYTPDGGETFYRTKGQVAQPYMYPALKRNEKKIQAMFKEAVKEQIEKAIGGK